MRFFLIISIHILCCSSLIGQTYFNKIFDYSNGYDEFISYNILNDKYIYLTGASDEQNGFNYALFSLIDTLGNIIWEKKYHYTTPDYGGVISFHSIQLESGTIVANGFMADTSEGATDIFLHAFNEQGDSLWFQNLDAGLNDRPAKMLLDDDGGILVLGYYYLGDFDSTRIIIIKTDSLGNKLWQKEYWQPNSYNFCYNWYKTEDGGYILAGERNDNNNQNINLLLMKLDSSFNELWAKSYDAGYLEYAGSFSNLIISDNEFIMVGQQEYFAPSTNTYRGKGIILKTDTAGNQKWLKLYGETSRNYYFKGIIDVSNNEHVVLGTVSNSTGQFAFSRALLIKIDSSGNEIWKREIGHYNDGRFEEGYPIFISKDEVGNMIFNGAILHQSSTRNDAWLVKTDSCGYTEGDESTAIINILQTQQQSISLSSLNSIYCDLRWYFGNGDSSTANNPNYTYSDTGTYTITLITRAGNDYDTATITIQVTGDDIITHILQTEVKIAFNIMPNPASNFIILKGDIPPAYSTIHFSVYDVVGKEILQQTFQQGQILEQIDVSQWARGIYSYRVTSKGKILKTGKVVVEH